MPKLVSANRLADGIVVYAAAGGAWVEQLSLAQIFASKEEAEARLLLAQEDAKRNLIVEPVLVDVAQEASGFRPLTLRETIRAQGPTIDFLALKKQAPRDAKPPPESPPKKLTESLLQAAQFEGPQTYAPQGLDLRSAQNLAEGAAR